VTATLTSQWDALESTEARRVLQTASLLGEVAQVPRARLALLTGLVDEAKEGYAAPLDEALIALHELSLVEELTEHEIRLHPLVQGFADETISDRPAFAEACAGRLADALWDMARLQAEVARRGIDAILADLRSALSLLPTTDHDSRFTPHVSRLTFLLRPLDLEAHHLRHWDPNQQPGFFLQQLRNESLELDLSELKVRAEAELAQLGQPHLCERFKVSRDSPELVRTFAGHSSAVEGVALSADEQMAVFAFRDKTLKVWDVATGRELRTLSGHRYVVYGLVLSTDGRLAVSASGRTLKVWEVATGQVVSTLATSVPLQCCAITPDGRTIVAGDEIGAVHFLELVGGGTTETLKRDEGTE
jgi:hypothetical protein